MTSVVPQMAAKLTQALAPEGISFKLIQCLLQGRKENHVLNGPGRAQPALYWRKAGKNKRSTLS
ncbi:MAG: hypothetical protein ABSC47_13425 [Terracidiphilus sp.]|jgi:hypothetical protein